MLQNTLYLALGSNLGDRLDSLQRAATALLDAGIEITASSRLYQTLPMYVTSQPFFLNAVLLARTVLQPLEFLALLHSIEGRLGRVRVFENGPRCIDLDILLWGTQGERIIVEPELLVPHPRLHERLFALAPLCDLAPSLLHPLLARTLAELASALPSQQVEIVAEADWIGLLVHPNSPKPYSFGLIDATDS